MLLAGASASHDVPILEARWVAPAARLQALTSRPAECGVDPGGTRSRSWSIGRAAFRTPLLLGGQAARAGLSCNACHQNGRGNPVFQFPGLSGAAGTADVTSSIMSRTRGDGTFNPKVISDLAVDQPKISHSNQGDLEAFIRGLIVEEFDGAEPPRAVLQGLADYVRAVRSGPCDRIKREDLSPETLITETIFAARAALGALGDHDPPTARLMIASARSQLGLIDERYGGAALTRDRARLRRHDDALRTIQTMIDAGAPNVAAAISDWIVAIDRTRPLLRKHVLLSLFSQARLARATAQ